MIAKIDTEGKAARLRRAAAAAAPPRPRRRPQPAAAAAAAAAARKRGVAMPAAAKLMADNQLAAGSVAGTGKDGRVTKGDVLGAVAGGARQAGRAAAGGRRRAGAPQGALPPVARRRSRRTSATAPSSACR